MVLGKWIRISLRFLGLLIVALILLLLSPSPSSSTSHQPPKILDPEAGDPPITGNQNIKVFAPFALAVDLYLFENIAFNPDINCYVIAEGIPVINNEVNHLWDSRQVVDSFYYLSAQVHYTSGSRIWDWVGISTENGKQGEECKPLEDPSDGDGSPGGNNPPPTSNNNPSSQPTSNTIINNEIIETPVASEDTSKAASASAGKAIVVFNEEIPITLDRFDPEIFLKGSEVEIKEIKTNYKNGTPHVTFSGTAPPETLVTLYAFSNPVIVVLQSGFLGNWSYDREKQIESGKHTAFATIYQEGVTRRSNTVDFFVAQGTSDGQSLILSKGSLQRFLPYVATLGGAVILAILTLTMYRIYSKRRQVKV